MADPVSRSSLAAAYARCERIARASGSSFLAAFWLFPPAERRALYALYAFCRRIDDIADDPDLSGDRGAMLARQRQELDQAFDGKATEPVGLALGDVIQRFRLPREPFDDLLDGIEFDLAGGVIERFEDLERYCYRVASTVGLLIVAVRGRRDDATRAYASELGIAVQLTNVLRDVRSDAEAGRVYLAREDLERMGVPREALVADPVSEELRLLLALYAERARIRFERARTAFPPAAAGALRPAQAMGAIYRDLLDALHEAGGAHLRRPLRVSNVRRVGVAARAWLAAGAAW